MIRVMLYNDETEQTIIVNPRHATMRRVPNEDYCFSVRLYGINQFEIDKLKQWAKSINQEYERR